MSRDERRQLSAIEKAVAHDDPDFAALFHHPGQPPHNRIAATAALTGVLVASLGLALFSPVLILGGAFLTLHASLRLVVKRRAAE